MRHLSPYPTVDESGEKADGFLLHLPRICARCEGAFCAELHQEATHELRHFTCPKGLSCFAGIAGSEIFVVCGVLDLALNRSCPRHIKKSLRSHKVPPGAVASWAASADKWRERLLSIQSRETAADTRNMLHDVKTMAHAMMRTCESMIESLPGDTDTEKFEQADPDQIRLIKAGRLMASCFRMMDIYVNPMYAKYGRKRQVAVYKLVDMMVRTLEDRAQAKGVHMDISGPSHNLAWVYDSFDVLPLVLLDNAIKYCQSHHAVHVVVRDVGESVDVFVDSFGRPIAEEERARIFEKGFRTEDAKGEQSSGSGLGLYIARIVAEAHGAQVEYEAIAQERGNINRFLFRVPPGVRS